MKKMPRAHLHAERVAQKMESEELVTPFRLLVVLIISASMVTAISFSAANNGNFVFVDQEDDINFTVTPYIFNFQKAMKTREENLEIYNHPSHQWTVEKRLKLSLEEFWDIYDCKWYN